MKRRFLPLRRAYRATPPARWTALPAIREFVVEMPLTRDTELNLDLDAWFECFPPSWQEHPRFLKFPNTTSMEAILLKAANDKGFTAKVLTYIDHYGPTKVAVRLSRPASRQPRPIGRKLSAALDKPARRA